MDEIYTSVSDSFITASLDKTLLSALHTPCYNLSSALGDTNGRITQSAVNQLVKSLEISSPGLVLLGEADDELEESATNDLLGTPKFINEISSPAFSLYNLYKISDSSVVFTTTTSISALSSPLLSLTRELNPIIRNSINSMYIECMAIYKALLKATSTSGVPGITPNDLTRVDNNIRWVGSKLEAMKYIPYDLISVLRDLQRTLMYVKSIDTIFSTTYGAKLKEMEVGDSV